MWPDRWLPGTCLGSNSGLLSATPLGCCTVPRTAQGTDKETGVLGQGKGGGAASWGKGKEGGDKESQGGQDRASLASLFL